MGYTHYFSVQRRITDEEWSRLLHAAFQLLRAMPSQTHYNGVTVPLRILFEESIPLPPQLGPRTIRFNGAGLAEAYQQPQMAPLPGDPVWPAPRSVTWQQDFYLLNHIDGTWTPGPALGHETFLLDRDDEIGTFAFCKTAYKPYDLVVCGLLIVTEYCAPGWRVITSDGQPSDWQPALAWVRSVVDEGQTLTLPSTIRDYE